jgi:hypothetical protein
MSGEGFGAAGDMSDPLPPSADDEGGVLGGLETETGGEGEGEGAGEGAGAGVGETAGGALARPSTAN